MMYKRGLSEPWFDSASLERRKQRDTAARVSADATSVYLHVAPDGGTSVAAAVATRVLWRLPVLLLCSATGHQ